MPEAEFVSPNAPVSLRHGAGRLSMVQRAGPQPSAMLAGVRAAAPLLDAFIDDELQKRGLEEKDAALVGFSQGTMMSLFVGLRRAQKLAGILGYSGRADRGGSAAGRVAFAPAGAAWFHGTATTRWCRSSRSPRQTPRPQGAGVLGRDPGLRRRPSIRSIPEGLERGRPLPARGAQRAALLNHTVGRSPAAV